MQSGSSYWKLWVGGAVVVAAAVWWFWPKAATTERTAGRSRGSSATDTATPDAGAVVPSRVVEVMVEGCRGPAPDALVFVKVGEHLVSGTTDPRGKVRIATISGPTEVRARVAGWESTALAGATDTSVVVRSCRSGEVTGRVWRYHQVTPAQHAVVRLVDAAGVQLDETVTDQKGDYRLLDADLTAAVVEVSDEVSDSLVETALEPLRPGEVREVNVMLGPTFELVGWVLDVRGDPLPGVLVSIVAENTGMTWRAVTDGGGAFRFERAPVMLLRLTADGGDLGIASRRVIAGNERRIDVTLVLEPTGAIMVLAPPELKGRVILTSWTTATISAPYEQPVEAVEYDVSDSSNGDPEVDGIAQVERMQTVLTEVFQNYDGTDPAAGLADVVLSIYTSFPELEQQMRTELKAEVPGIDDMRFEVLARIAAEKAIAEDPKLPQVMALAAEKTRNGANGLEAFMAANQEVQESHQAASSESKPDTAYDDESIFVAPEAVPLDESSPLFKRLKELFGDEVLPYYPDDANTAGQGALGEAIQVPGAMRYQVTIIFDETDPDTQRYALRCGEVLVPAGRTIEMYCGRETEALITGTVVDVRGRPVEGAQVILEENESTMTDRDGNYTLTWSGRTAIPCALRVVREVGGEAWRPSERVNLQCAPGHSLEVAPITLRREDEAPVHHPETPFGGVGGALANGVEGVQISYVRPDGPLALDGIDELSTILRVDDEDATSWPVEEMLTRLRGDVGSLVQLQVRAPDGEIIETVIERGLIAP